MGMKKIWKRILRCVAFSMVLVFCIVGSYKPITTYALAVTPVNVKMYTTSGTPVFATPDLYSGVVVIFSISFVDGNSDFSNIFK